jgi:hypothetical protein
MFLMLNPSAANASCDDPTMALPLANLARPQAAACDPLPPLSGTSPKSAPSGEADAGGAPVGSILSNRIGAACQLTQGVAIEKSAAKLAAFERALLGCEEVMECYLMTGAFDYIVRLVASDMAGIERFVMTRLATIDGVRDVITSITLRRVQYKTVLPVREGGE